MQLTIFHGTWPMALGPRQESGSVDGSLDTVLQDYLVGWPGWRGSLASLGISKNQPLPGYARVFANAFDVTQEDEARAICTVRGIGLLGITGDKRTREISSQGRVISIGPIGEEGNYKKIVTPSGIGEKWNINEPDLSLSDSYFSTTKPVENQQGTALTPPSPPPPPIYQWAGFADGLRFNHPNGWVLDQRTSTEIVPGKLWAVRDLFVFYQPAAPG